MTAKPTKKVRVIRKPFEHPVQSFQLNELKDPVTGQVLRESLIDRRDGYDVENPDIRITRYQRVDNLERLVSRGNIIQRHHFLAGDRYRKDWELAMHSGLPARDYSKASFGNSASTLPVRQAMAMTRWKDAEAFVGETLVTVLRFIVLENKTIKEWSSTTKMNPSVALGRLSAALDRLHEYYAFKAK